MKQILSLLLMCLLLCGCARETPIEETSPPPTTEAAAPVTEPVGMYEAGHPLEAQYQGSLRVYPLDIRKVRGMWAMDNGLLLLSGYGSTTFTLLTGDDLFVSASMTVDCELDVNDPSLRVHGDTVSFFDPEKRETVVLNGALKEVSRIPVVEDLVGSPILSADRNTLYYCTSTAIRAWNLETGIHRCVKELCYEEQVLTGLHMDDTVLQCRILDGGQEHTLFVAADTGRLLYEAEGAVTLATSESRYFASIPAGTYESHVFGTADGSVKALMPGDVTAECFYLERHNAVIAVSGDAEVALEYYELDTGLRRSTLMLESLSFPSSIADTADGYVYVLLYNPEADCNTVYRWDVGDGSSLLVHDSKNYTGTYYTAATQDIEGLAHCQAYAAEIGSKYGIEVLVWNDALAAQPWDYDFEAEYLVPVLQRELTLLDQRLGQFPERVLADTISHFTALKICLVRQITGTAESGSLDTATGIQFFDGTDAYVAIAVGDSSAHALYHEFFHVMETHLLTESTAFDQWEELNPSGFTYDYDYSANAQRESDAYLYGDTRAFIDTYSMSFPKEDRARVMEYAMLDGNAYLFQSKTLQAKLVKLCEGIREAYGLRKSPETFVWEQYLEKSLAYTE